MAKTEGVSIIARPRTPPPPDDAMNPAPGPERERLFPPASVLTDAQLQRVLDLVHDLQAEVEGNGGSPS
jgi:hypothetical protein